MGWLGGTSAPPRGEALEAETRRHLEWYEGAATRYRIMFVLLGLVAVLGGLSVTVGALAAWSRTFFAIAGLVVVVSELLLQFFQVQNRYVGYRLAAEAHREALGEWNDVFNSTEGEEKDKIAAADRVLRERDLRKLRHEEVVAWAKATMTVRPKYVPGKDPLEQR